ncbi:hypothetical protein ACFL3E_00475 [Patescibacteria group bacterium]
MLKNLQIKLNSSELGDEEKKNILFGVFDLLLADNFVAAVGFERKEGISPLKTNKSNGRCHERLSK